MVSVPHPCDPDQAASSPTAPARPTMRRSSIAHASSTLRFRSTRPITERFINFVGDRAIMIAGVIAAAPPASGCQSERIVIRLSEA
jgi:hypothetical protein